MSVTTVKDFISKQNVKKLAEDIVLGPQAEVLTLIEQFNNRWRSNIAIRNHLDGNLELILIIKKEYRNI